MKRIKCFCKQVDLSLSEALIALGKGNKITPSSWGGIGYLCIRHDKIVDHMGHECLIDFNDDDLSRTFDGHNFYTLYEDPPPEYPEELINNIKSQSLSDVNPQQLLILSRDLVNFIDKFYEENN